MRILFNHGLTPGELYTNTPKKIIDKPWRWLIRHYGSSTSYNDAIAAPFKYCFGLILNRILDEKVRFKIPYQQDAYIDFEIVTGEKFIKHRQNGRFQEIDFVESDFTGYFLTYFFKGSAYQKEIPIYIGSNLKKKFLSNINSGEKFYTIKDITIDDFIDDVKLKFNEFTHDELKKLLIHGFRRMHSAIRYGCAISISVKRDINCLAYIGKLTLTPEKNIKEYSVRRDKKLRKIDIWKKLDFDGYYYIGLNETAMKLWVELNRSNKVIVKFQNVIPRKIKEELYYKDKFIHIFRFKQKKFRGFNYWCNELKIRDLEYLGEVLDRKFYPMNKTWRELIKEYEKK